MNAVVQQVGLRLQLGAAIETGRRLDTKRGTLLGYEHGNNLYAHSLFSPGNTSFVRTVTRGLGCSCAFRTYLVRELASHLYTTGAVLQQMALLSALLSQ